MKWTIKKVYVPSQQPLYLWKFPFIIHGPFKIQGLKKSQDCRKICWTSTLHMAKIVKRYLNRVKDTDRLYMRFRTDFRVRF